jgi:PPOX class probable F420-dependent enzyme
MNATHATLAHLASQPTVLLTTYRRDGTPVGTPVHLAVDGDRGVFRTWNTAWKIRRIGRNPQVTIAPSTLGGRPTGRPVTARARILDGAEARRAAELLGRKYPVIHSWLIPLAHRLMGKRTVHVELVPVG